MTSIKYSCVVPKSSGFISFLKDLAFSYDIKLDLDYDEVGFIFKTQNVRFKASCENEDKLDKFISNLGASIEDYKEQISHISGGKILI